jgi:hypothetical protein
MKKVSRRSALFSAGLLSLTGSTRAEAADRELIGLGQQFDSVATKLDRAIEHALNIEWSDLEDFGRIVDKIVVTPATTIEGLCVKARVGCWGLLGDLDDPGEEAPAGVRAVRLASAAACANDTCPRSTKAFLLYRSPNVGVINLIYAWWLLSPAVCAGGIRATPNRLRFSPPRALGVKVGDEFTIPL